MRHVGTPTLLATLIAGLVLASIPAMACDLSQPETGKVASIIDGETLKLADGRTVRPANCL
jgi:endonuclease YncB( thermonuclease family)